MTIAAIYARKSTSQEKATEEAKSVARQVDLARAFAERQGWTVDEQRVYTDDGISGGEFLKRPALAALLAAARTRPRPFDVLVMMNQSRLGRRLRYTQDAVHDLCDTGVRIFFYQTGQEVKLDTATGRFMVSVHGFADDAYRDSIRETTRESLRRKAERGEVAGGKVYGYRNEAVTIGGKRSHAVRVVDEAQAAVVRRIFGLTAEGLGLLKIAKRLNAEGTPSPRGDGWATTAIREMLRRELYRGQIVYGRTQWVDRGETKVKVAVRDRSAWIIVDAPELRIVPEELWRAAHARMARTRQTHTGQRRPLEGRAESGLVSNHLLSGFLRCGLCGGNMFVAPRSGKRGERQLYYVCTTHHKRGNTRCTNRWGVPYHDLTDDVLNAIKEVLLRPDAIEAVVAARLEEIAAEPDEQRAQKCSIRARLTALDREIARYTLAIGQTDTEVRPLVEALQTRQRERTELSSKLEHLDGLETAAQTWDADRLRRFVTPLVRNLEITLYHPAIPQQARAIIRDLVTSPIKVTPRDGGTWFEYEAQFAYDWILRGALGTGWTTGPSVTKANTTEMVPPG